MSRIVFSFLIFAMLFIATQSESESFDNEYEEKPWAEIEVQLPAFPAEGDLIPFKVGSNSETQYMIDGRSLSVGADKVIRYTLVVVSSSGARNISYEGMRCATVERRFYASGSADKTWLKARGGRWTRIAGNSNNHHVELYNGYLCTLGVYIETAEEAIEILRSGGLWAKRK